jgi:glutathione S-transferase
MKVHYFAGYGRAEAIRMTLAHAKVPFENVNYAFGEELAKVKASGNLEFGQLPVLQEGDKYLAQSVAIQRYIGMKYGYYPTENPELCWRIDSTIDSLGDILNAFYKAAFAPEDQKGDLFKTFFTTTLPQWLNVLNKRLLSNSSKHYLVGDKITIADFALAAWAYSIYLNDLSQVKDQVTPIVAQFPELDAYFRGLGEDLKEYLAGRPKCPW